MNEDFNEVAQSSTNLVIPSVRDKNGMGYDIYSLLLKERIIIVEGQVESQMASNIIAQLKFLESQDEEKPITMLINSPGGSVTDGLAILDIMREVKCPIHTVGNGMQASMGSILLVGGDMRRMTKNSKVLVHQIMGGAAGGTQHTDFEIEAASMADEHEALKNVYVEFTGLNHKFWDAVGERDTWLSAEQALKMGYIHHIVENEKPGGPYAAEATRSEAEQNIFEKTAKAAIKKMKAGEIIEILNNGQANKAEWGRYRPELVAKLAEFPEFWVAKRQEEYKLKQAASGVANDDKKADAPEAKAKRVKGHKPA